MQLSVMKHKMFIQLTGTCAYPCKTLSNPVQDITPAKVPSSWQGIQTKTNETGVEQSTNKQTKINRLGE
jgi:hypothetical protein